MFNFAFVKRIVNSKWRYSKYHDLQDLYQAGAIGLLYAMEHVDQNDPNFVGYAKKCIIGAVVDQIRKEQGRRYQSPVVFYGQDSQIVDDTTLEEVNILTIFEDLVRGQPERTAEMIRMHYIEGWTLLEIAIKFNVSESRVCQCLRETRSQLRRMLSA